MSASSSDRKRAVIRWLLGAGFAFSMLMAVGPGVLLVNRPESFLGMPLIYAWAVLWYLVLCGIALLADRLLWSAKRKEKE